jgi:hypothetical protein
MGRHQFREALAMLRYKLRTLLIVLALGPPVLACGWSEYGKYRQRERLREELQREVEEVDRLRRAPHNQGFQLDVF